ncbi:unnamed protein product [Miscanthus lutarioriparius]|uniref:C2H2-type domain-containing protein n=1 Tax=Miscanthus lutarioriparius TaxID=422564 RepID=A0A811Q0Y9_9POAL|nr:unnamed protein product [Miscanthus lutarioriparius]
MELGPERKDHEAAGARASPSSLSPSSEADGDKDLPKQQQRAIGDDDDDDDDEGTRQPYKCTFCRRGFPTAQALGGHMNVHRRHRGRPAVSAGAAVGSSAASVYYYDQQPCSTMTTSTTPVLAFTQQATTRPAAGGVAALHAQRKPHELLPLFGRGDCCAAVRGSGAAAEDVREDRYFAIAEEGDGGEELDLELRLGGAGS